MILLKREISLPDLPERPGRDIVLTPRSREACLSEGIDLSEICYRDLEEFADRQLSPRIVKLRYDYFEAKRKDLMVLALEAHEKLLKSRKSASFKRSSSSSRTTIASISTAEGSEWGMLSIEKEKLARFQQGEKKWLENCLRHEVDLLRKLEADDQRLTEENRDSTKKMAEESKRIKELNDRRRVIEEQKLRVAEAHQELEKEKAKKAFAAHQEELHKMQEKEVERKKQAHLRSLKDAETRALKELEQKEQENKLWAGKQEALREIHQADLERLRIIERCKRGILKKMTDRQSSKQARVNKSIEKNREQENKRKRELLDKLVADQNRDERLAIAKHQQMEESAKRSLQLILKRKIIQNESQKKLESRRQEIVAHQEEIDRRLAEHEQKRNRYFDFKHELEVLREKNKHLNVERQRKKERYLRDTYAQKIVEKDSKIELIFSERQQLWEARRKTALESQMSRDHVKRTIMEMRTKSKTDSKKLESYVDSVLKRIGPAIKEESNDLACAPEILFFDREAADVQDPVDEGCTRHLAAEESKPLLVSEAANAAQHVKILFDSIVTEISNEPIEFSGSPREFNFPPSLTNLPTENSEEAILDEPDEWHAEEAISDDPDVSHAEEAMTSDIREVDPYAQDTDVAGSTELERELKNDEHEDSAGALGNEENGCCVVLGSAMIVSQAEAAPAGPQYTKSYGELGKELDPDATGKPN